MNGEQYFNGYTWDDKPLWVTKLKDVFRFAVYAQKKLAIAETAKLRNLGFGATIYLKLEVLGEKA